jgi:nucleoside-diphosphate-sugar epimerase
MKNALIGHTGFIGSNLIRQREFDEFYNSKNIESIIDRQFDILVCSGAPAVKWLANKEPVKDKENLDRLMSCLAKVSANKLILMSSVDVYPVPIEVDEDTPIDASNLHPYGKHRFELENFVRDNFDSLIIRFPGLFGVGLKKNIIYDFLNNNLVNLIHKDSVFQFYNLANLWQDIQTSLDRGLKLINFATEPTSVSQVAKVAFDFDFTNEPEQVPAKYDMQTKYSQLFNNDESAYLYDKDRVLLDLKDFVAKQKN